jgi:GNAT superfamily N-acetyltransferase
MTINQRDIEANELLFVEQHRSAVWDAGPGRLFVSSDREVKTWNFIGALEATDAPWDEFLSTAEGQFSEWKMTPCIKLTPSSPPELEPLLVAAGWKEAVRLTHMVHPTRRLGPADSTVAVRVCTTPDEVRTFSEVQSAGFDAPEWVDWVHKVNVVNVRRSNQRFYVADRDGEPAGVCLLLLSGRVAGLYAVATLAASRGRGIARALVARAASDAELLGATTLCLNTATGGAAQEAFRRLGFEDAFDSRFLVKGAE